MPIPISHNCPGNKILIQPMRKKTIRCRFHKIRFQQLVVVMMLVTLGCSDVDPNLKPVFPVQGGVYFKGNPAEGDMVTFHPLPLESGQYVAVRSRGTVSEDGMFKLTTYNTDDGAPQGDYAVTIYWPAKPTGTRDNFEDEGTELPRDKLGLRFSNPASTSLRVEIKAPSTELLPFKIE